MTRGDACTPVNGTSIILFDGVCNLCNGAVLFIIDRDPAGRFRFAPLQSELAVGLLRSLGEAGLCAGPTSSAGGETGSTVDSVVLVQDGQVYQRSDAVVRIARQLTGPWRLLAWGSVMPRVMRDWAYDLVARHRYRWFGREQDCRVPTPELRQRFLA